MREPFLMAQEWYTEKVNGSRNSVYRGRGVRPVSSTTLLAVDVCHHPNRMEYIVGEQRLLLERDEQQRVTISMPGTWGKDGKFVRECAVRLTPKRTKRFIASLDKGLRSWPQSSVFPIDANGSVEGLHTITVKPNPQSFRQPQDELMITWPQAVKVAPITAGPNMHNMDWQSAPVTLWQRLAQDLQRLADNPRMTIQQLQARQTTNVPLTVAATGQSLDQILRGSRRMTNGA